MKAFQSEYLHWAKMFSAAKYNLARSDLQPYALNLLEVGPSEIDEYRSGPYGSPELKQLIAIYAGVSPDNVVTTFGTAMANHLAMAVSIDAGDEVLIEDPVYEPILATALYFGANVRRFERRADNGFVIDADDVKKTVSPKTRLIVLTNLHNPSSAFTDDQTLREIGKAAESAGARVLIDEVYLEAAFEKNPRSAFHLGETFITTNSLTKVYGLSSLRCGWILADKRTAGQIWRLIDVYYATNPVLPEIQSIKAFRRMEELKRRSKNILDINHRLVQNFFAECPGLEIDPVQSGLVVFPKLKKGTVDTLDQLLRAKYDTGVVPGKFFERPDRFRIGVGMESGVLQKGLAAIAGAVTETY